MFSNITRGGQLQIHQFRMLYQIISLALLLSISISIIYVIIFGYRDLSTRQARHTLEYLKANSLVKLASLTNNQKIIVKSKNILTNKSYKIAYLRTIDSIIKRANQAGLMLLLF